MSSSELFWNASLEELKQGYMFDQHVYTCLLCGKQTEKGIVYSEKEVFYEAERFMRRHIEAAHESVFSYLIQLNKKLTGLTEHQNSLLQLFYEGRSDSEVQKELGIGSASTIRNHRFALKEKERQAKIFLAMMELLKEKDRHAPSFVELHQTATMVDDRYNITHDESEKVIGKYFPEGPQGALKSFPLKEKNKLVILRELVKRFSSERKYTEKEVNEVLKQIFHDHVTLRRYLIEYGFLDRLPDGSEYWVKA
ncbi:DUF2087 domain-containing protein [Paenibacillus hexagrammi]|uniref:DUF2087 domain-containing protein n=1 Tax=Paenibacillus hexagrammi TaxID=2908839 RepID=A0ABY3SS75_9BACL|nr:DUF2087 domain-containing protein [Paenibacillus sp. YPD9-1]UJF35832.1 DUF2087 domain-containing protein [Paenibacillus sp. YPD9-1]